MLFLGNLADIQPKLYNFGARTAVVLSNLVELTED